MNISYIVSPAETIDFPGGSFDVITACQCFPYFDKAVIGQKLHRLLKDGGHFCNMSMIWLPAKCEIAQTSETIILKYNPAWTGAGFTREASAFGVEMPECLEGLFETVNTVSFDVPLSFTRKTWHGRMKACRGIGASSLSAEQIAEWEKEHIAYLQTVSEEFDILHFVTMLILRKSRR